MGTTFDADVPGNEQLFVMDIASAATNGTAQNVLFEAPSDLIITEAAWIPDGADQEGHGTSYRTQSIINLGTAGSGSTVVGSKAFTASLASLTAGDFTITSTNASIDDGEIVAFKTSVTTAAASSDMAAGVLQVRYRLL